MTSKISPKTIFSSVALVIALGSLEKSIVTTPLPMIGAELHAGAALTWVVTAYLLAATAVLPLYGKLSDSFGRVRMLNIGIGLFLVGSVACALSQICRPCWRPACCKDWAAAALLPSRLP